MYPPNFLCQTPKLVIIIQRNHPLAIYATSSCEIPIMHVDVSVRENYYEWVPSGATHQK